MRWNIAVIEWFTTVIRRFTVAIRRVTAVVYPKIPRTTPRAQPWRHYWPPIPGTDLYKWYREKHSWVLTWRFDPNNPFDRPWLENGTKDTQGTTPEAASSTSSFAFADLCLQNASSTISVAPNRDRLELDKFLKRVQLPIVEPDLFKYLASLEYYLFQKPYKCQIPCFGKLKKTNVVTCNFAVKIYEVSGNEHLFTLAQSGFTFAKCPIQLKERSGSGSGSYMEKEYILEMENWLRQHFDAERVLIYACNFRLNNPEGPKPDKWKGAFFRVHCDASEATCHARVRLHFPDEYEELLKTKRIRFINVWRALSTPIQDCPLAVCDFRSLSKGDLVPCDLVYPHFLDEAYEVLPNPKHRWFYKQGMQRDDVLMFKLCDTLKTEATVCPHSAFIDPTAPPDTPPRSSVEVKAIIIN